MLAREENAMVDGDSVLDLESLARETDDFRREVRTTERSQIVLMTIPAGEDIGEEVHPENDQWLGFVDGEAEAVIEGESSPVRAGQLVLVPAGTRHNFVNKGSAPLRLWTLYAPPDHAPGTVHRTKAEALAEEEH
jgi:mannose-6-phosphate isomerase-like protein (cupin superfamily)